MIPNFQTEVRLAFANIARGLRGDAALLTRSLPKEWAGIFVGAMVIGALFPPLAFHVGAGLVDAWIGARGLGAATGAVYGGPLALVAAVVVIWLAQVFVAMFEGKLRAVARRRTLELSAFVTIVDLIVLGWWLTALVSACAVVILATQRWPLWWQRLTVITLLIIAVVVASGDVIQFVISRAITVGEGMLTLSLLVYVGMVVARLGTLGANE